MLVPNKCDYQIKTWCHLWLIYSEFTDITVQDIVSYSMVSWHYTLQANLDVSGLLVKNVSEPLQEMSKYKMSQAQKLQTFRENLEHILQQSEDQCQEAGQALHHRQY